MDFIKKIKSAIHSAKIETQYSVQIVQTINLTTLITHKINCIKNKEIEDKIRTWINSTCFCNILEHFQQIIFVKFK